MKIFKHKSFHEWALSEKLSDNALKQAINEMDDGLYEATLGSGLYKKRIASPGQGKRGSYRTLIAFKKDDIAFFMYGFAKNVRDNINEKEEKILRKLAKDFLNMTDDAIHRMMNNGKLFEVK